MRDRLLETLAGWALHRPGRTLWILVALTVLAATRLPLLGVDAGHSGMIDADRPAQVQLRSFEARFGSPNQLVVLVEGGDEPARRRAVDALTAALPGGPVRDAMGRVDRAAMAELALFFADDEGARAAVDGLVGGGLARVRALAAPRHLLAALSAELEARGAEPAPEGEAAEARARQGMEAVARLLDALTATLKGPGAPPLMRAMLPAEAAAPGLDDAGYLSSTDGGVKLVLVRPTVQTDDPAEVVPFVEVVRARAGAAVGADLPDVRVTLTGMPALIADEAAAIESDMWVTGLYATAGLLLVLGVGYRSLRRTLLALAPLPFVLVWTLAFVQLTFGTLNLLTGAVVPVLLGLCIDASVHLLARFDEARERLDVGDAVRDAIHGVGPGLLTGVFTTSGAFFALIVTDFRGFREMGLMTAFGLVAGLAVTSTLLPALLTLPRLSFFRDDEVAPPRAARAGAAVARFARPLAVGGLALLGASLLVARPVPWSYDWVALLPDTPATAALARLEARTGYSASGAAVEVGSLEDAARVAAALGARATVARTETAIDLLPAPSAARAEALRRLPAAGEPAPPAPADVEGFGEAADELADALEDAWLDARRASAAQAAWLEAPARRPGGWPTPTTRCPTRRGPRRSRGWRPRCARCATRCWG
ncbi:MAG: MMPL family transporter [Myxococcales bacterium]|nr:MMPL family transporter [Myxococcales bacterium]